MTTIFRKTQIKKEKLREIILKNPGYLQTDLSFIDLQIGSGEDGLIDFLGVDKSGRLLVLDFDVRENDTLLITALSHMQWLKNNETLVKRLFFSENIDFTKTPSVMLIAPSFSRKLKAAVTRLDSISLKLVSFSYILAEDRDAILFEDVLNSPAVRPDAETPLESDGAGERQEESKREPSSILSPQNTEEVVIMPPKAEVKKAKNRSLLEEVSLTAEEIAEFMDFNKEFEKESA